MSLIADALNKTKFLLTTSELIKSYNIRAEEAREEEGYLRIKAEIVGGDRFELFEYYVLDGGVVELSKYSFHWQKRNGKPIKRWDNVGHYPGLANFPHHVHLGERKVESSPKMSVKLALRILGQSLMAGGKGAGKTIRWAGLSNKD